MLRWPFRKTKNQHTIKRKTIETEGCTDHWSSQLAIDVLDSLLGPLTCSGHLDQETKHIIKTDLFVVEDTFIFKTSILKHLPFDQWFKVFNLGLYVELTCPEPGHSAQLLWLQQLQSSQPNITLLNDQR